MNLIEDLDREIFEKLPEDKFSILHQEETIYLLDNLGYIEYDKSKSINTISGKDIFNGISLFRNELKNSRNLSIQKNEIGGSGLTEGELDFLAILSSLENEFKLHKFKISTIERDPILCRVLNFRINIISLYSGKINPSIGKEVRFALNKLKIWVGANSEQEAIKFSGNIVGISETIANGNLIEGKSNHLVFFFNQIDNKSEINFRNSNIHFQERLKFIPEQTLDRFNFLVQGKKIKKAKRLEFKKIQNDEFNLFLIRLLQIRMWLLGTYDGKLDSDMGPLSLKAFQDLAEFTNFKRKELSKPLFNPKEVLFHLGKGDWVLNYKYLLGLAFPKLIDPKEDKNTEITITGEINQLIQLVDGERQNEIFSTINNIVDIEFNSNTSKKKKKTRKGKGIFRGVKNFFSKVNSTIKKGIKNIVEAVKKFFSWIKNGVTYLLKELREAYLRIKTLVKFVFSRRKIFTTSKNLKITTDFDFDFDFVTRINGDLNNHLIKEHIKENSDTLRITTKVLGVLEIAFPLLIDILLGPFGWVKSGFQLVKLFRKSSISFPKVQVLKFIV